MIATGAVLMRKSLQQMPSQHTGIEIGFLNAVAETAIG
jgi:hypothetical protein